MLAAKIESPELRSNDAANFIAHRLSLRVPELSSSMNVNRKMAVRMRMAVKIFGRP